MNKATTSATGFSIFTVLFLIFLVLKLLGKITWSWWWVTCPLWAPWGVALLVIGVVCLMIAVKS
jgi:hypothetical protein